MPDVPNLPLPSPSFLARRGAQEGQDGESARPLLEGLSEKSEVATPKVTMTPRDGKLHSLNEVVWLPFRDPRDAQSTEANFENFAGRGFSPGVCL